MNPSLSAAQILDREFLELRAKLLELAASLDRIERAAGSVQDDTRLAQIRHGLQTLLENRTDRAEQVQLIFSRAYRPDWQAEFGLTRR
jgi:hypothetical protein